MRLTSQADAFGAVGDILSARLETHGDRPLALALSGGGDSIALLRLVAAWARANGRRLLALTVDHGVNPDSPAWSRLARAAAHAEGVDWRELRWDGPKPSTGLPAAARRARHALLAQAARAAGARVILMGHTAGDVVEGEVMRAEGSTLGTLREWAPSPAWPDGRGLMLLRPMLGLRRREIRDWLAEQGAAWTDDPANEDLRFGRSRARAFLLPMEEDGPRSRSNECQAIPSAQVAAPVCDAASPKAWERRSSFRARTTAAAGVRSSPLSSAEGTLAIERTIDAHALAVALVCAGGGDRPPRGERLDALLARLRDGKDFTVVLAGARVEVAGPTSLVTREAGEFARRSPSPLPLSAGVEAVWDGRWALTVDSPGWSVVPAAGRRARLPRADRAWLDALPAAARGGQPVLIRDGGGGAVLARTAGRAWSLVEQRLALALDTTPHERDLG